MIECWICP